MAATCSCVPTRGGTPRVPNIFSPVDRCSSGELESLSEFPEVRGSWVYERKVGAGCFGRVTLWKNTNSGEVLALKTYEKNPRKKSNNKDRLEARWTEEKLVTQRLSHSNIIHGCTVPEELTDSTTLFPPIAMEYCSGGSLAEMLLLPENSCGFPEVKVIQIAHDICCAIEYLHENHIIHRDIKPGNILLKDHSDMTTYKLIDFGFAKDMMGMGSTRSVCGTPMYIAPEVVNNTKYTHTLDYWSLGCVIFKCIAGVAPFPHYRQANGKYWRDFVLNKPLNIIHIYMDEIAQMMVSSSNIPVPNQLCRVRQHKLEKWLCLMLDSDGSTRGGGLSADRRPVCFVVLDEIIATKIVHILSVPTNQLLSYSTGTRKESVRQLKLRIESETTIAADQQEIVSSSGEELAENTIIKDYAGDYGDNKRLLYLFSKGTMSHWHPIKDPSLFSSTELLLQGSKRRNHQIVKFAWTEFLFYGNEVVRNYKQLLHAKNAAMLNLLQLHLHAMKTEDKVTVHLQSKLASLSQFKNSVVSISKKQPPGKQAEAAEDWAKVNIKIGEVDQLSRKSVLVKKAIRQLETTKENSKAGYLTTLNDVVLKCSNLIDHIIMDKALKPGRTLLKPLVVQFQSVREKLYRDIYAQFGSIVECKASVKDLIQQFETTRQQMALVEHSTGNGNGNGSRN